MGKCLALALTIPAVSSALFSQTSSPASQPGNAAAPRADAWKILGPGGGGTMIAPVFNPRDPKNVLVHCDMTGAYITHDGGRSWRMFNLRGVVRAYAFDPADPKVLYAGSMALWKSTDAGQIWKMIWPDPAKNTFERCIGDHGEARVYTDDKTFPGRGISSIAVDPADGRHVVVAAGGKLYESRDAGASFSPMHAVNDAIETITFTAKGVLFAVGNSGIYREEGKGWARIALPGRPPQPPQRNQRALIVSIAWPKDQSEATLYTTAPVEWKDGKPSGGVLVSTDGGGSWSQTLSNLQESVIVPPQSPPDGMDRQAMYRNRSPSINQVTCCEANPQVAYAAISGLRLAEGEAGLYYGILKTIDGGKRWHVVHKESNSASPTMQGSWFERRASEGTGLGSVYFTGCWSLSCSPSDPDTCYATDLFRTYMTSDGGKSWRQCHSCAVGDPAENRWSTRGLDVTTCYGVHFDPFDHNNVYISYTDIGLFRSNDGGTSWTSSIAGIPSDWANTTYWLEFDPKLRGLLWGAFSGTHDLPRPKMFRRQNPDRYRGGVGTSTDGGKTWKPTTQGMPQTAVTHILMDPDSPVGSRTLYACGFGKGVYKSTDNGKSWTLKNKGLPGYQPFAWRMIRSPDKSLYLVIARRNETDENIVAPAASNSAPVAASEAAEMPNGSLYHSTDGGENWVKMDLPAGCTGPSGLAIDPAEPNRMYLAAWAQVTAEGNQAGGVFGSTDGGRSWKRLMEMPHAYDVTIDPANPKVLYTCGFDSAAYRSADGGATWSRIKGYNFKWGHRVIVDPDRPGMIYITTFGGSVWHGPATGDPSGREDIVPEVLQKP